MPAAIHSAAASGDLAVATQEWIAPPWRFHLRLPPGYRAHPGPRLAPGSYPQLLARYERAEPRTTIDVRASALDREVDAADWLACSPLLAELVRPEDVVSEQGGRLAQASAESQTGGWLWTGRFFAHKAGARMFIVSVRAPSATRALDQAFEGARASFAPVLDPDAPFAEPLRICRGDVPVRWHTRLPASWIYDPGSRGDKSSAFQAENVRSRHELGEEMIGKLAFAVLARSVAVNAREVASLYFDAMREHGLAVRFERIAHERPLRPFLGAWHLHAAVEREHLPGEVRCRILCHERVWILGGVLSMRRQDDVEAWMQNKRALDLVTRSLRLAS